MITVFHYDSCFGFRLWKSNNRSVELWFCPPNYRIIKHSHPLEDIELTFLWGCAAFYRQKTTVAGQRESLPTEECAIVRWPWNMFRTFTIKAGWWHWFAVSKSWLVFINHAKWKQGVEPTSASVDFLPFNP